MTRAPVLALKLDRDNSALGVAILERAVDG